MSKVVAEFTPRHLEKAVDIARHIATFGQLEFAAGYIRLQITDPAKVVFFDMILTPEQYRCDSEFRFGINLPMFYKLLCLFDNNETLEIEADESVLKLNQGCRFHTLLAQDLPYTTPEIQEFTGPKVRVPTKLFQRYIRALGNISPAFEMHFVPSSDTLFLESVNSMYRTLFSLDTSASPGGEEEYRKSFMVKFVEVAVNPSLQDTVELTLGDTLTIGYEQSGLSVLVTVAGYTEG